MHPPHYHQNLHRVKVYKLNSELKWDERGCGHTSVEYMEQADAMGLIVVSENEDAKTLLVHKISRDDIYQRSGDSHIITWRDPEINTEVAISFAEAVGCDHIWHQIKQVQREVMQHSDYRPRHGAIDEYEQQAGNQFEDGDGQGSIELPPPEIGNLEEIAKVLANTSPFHRERVASLILKTKYIPALLDIFKQCEDLDDMTSLGHLYRIIKGTIMLNDAALLEELLKEEHVMDVVGALEYDPELKTQQKHREFLQGCVQFKEVVPIHDPKILAWIHQTYRIQYIKDVILPRTLDDATYATLSSLALFNNVEVVSALDKDLDFLPELFLRLEKHVSTDPEWHNLVAFLQEFCSLARHLQQAARQELFNKLVKLGMFEVVTRIMTHSPEAVKLRATDILISAMQHDTSALRKFMLKQKDHTLFSLLIRELAQGSGESGLPEQLGELLKMLLDPETMDSENEKKEFLDLFYDKYLSMLVDVIRNDKAISKEGTRHVPAPVLGIIVDVLSFCVQHNSYSIKYYVLRLHVVKKVLFLLHRRERWLKCAAVRFVRTCLALKEDFFPKHLVKYHVDNLDPIMNTFFENGERYNLLNSAILELVDFIRRENIKVIMEHLVKVHGNRFDEVTYVDTLQQLRRRWEQVTEAQQEQEGPPGVDQPASVGTSNATAAAGIHGRTFVFSPGGQQPGASSSHSRALMDMRRRRDARALDKDEEDYFSEDTEGDWEGGEDSAGPSTEHQGGYAAAASAPAQQQQQQQQRGGDLGRRVPDGGRISVSPAAAAGSRGSPGPPTAAAGLGPGGPSSGAGRSGSSQANGPSSSSPEWRGLVEYEDDDDENGNGTQDGGTARDGKLWEGSRGPYAGETDWANGDQHSKRLKGSQDDSPGSVRNAKTTSVGSEGL